MCQITPKGLLLNNSFTISTSRKLLISFKEPTLLAQNLRKAPHSEHTSNPFADFSFHKPNNKSIMNTPTHRKRPRIPCPHPKKYIPAFKHNNKN